MATPVQYEVKRPTLETGGLSPLQLALAYYMDLAQQVPFAVNTDFVTAIKTYSDSGVVLPSDLGLDGTSIVADGPLVKMIRRAENCGPLEIERYEQITIGNRADLLPNAWDHGVGTIRGGSISAGAGGPWGTGGLTSAFPGPCNAVDRPPNIINGNYFDAYSTGEGILVADLPSTVQGLGLDVGLTSGMDLAGGSADLA